MQRSDNPSAHPSLPRFWTTGRAALALILGLAILAGVFFSHRLPKNALASFFKNPLQSVKSSAGFLASTGGYDGRWHTRDPDDPPVMMDVRFSMHACDVEE